MRYLFPLNPTNQQRQYEKMVWVFPAHLAMYATYLRNKGHEVYWGNHHYEKVTKHDEFCGIDRLITWSHKCRCSGKEINDFNKVIKDDFDIDVPFEKLPYPDRIFTDAKNPRWQSYGNYKFHPATHMMASNLCWYGRCTFCIDTAKLEGGEKRGVRAVGHVMEEIDDLISQGYREVFDDSGTFPVGHWLNYFCSEMQSRKKKITIGCNMKPVKLDYKMMANAGFRFILVGIESANQETVDKIHKGQRSEDIIPIMKSMANAGLEVHLTSMFGYEWETHEDAMRTVKLVHYLLKNGYVKTAQASVYSPPRTKPDPNSSGHKYIPMIYDAYKSPAFWIRKLQDIKRWEDITYLLRGGRLVFEEKVRKIWNR